MSQRLAEGRYCRWLDCRLYRPRYHLLTTLYLRWGKAGVQSSFTRGFGPTRSHPSGHIEKPKDAYTLRILLAWSQILDTVDQLRL